MSVETKIDKLKGRVTILKAVPKIKQQGKTIK